MKRKILSLLLVVLVLFIGVAAVGCDGGTNEWPEAGVYTFADGVNECTLVLNEGNTFTIVYKDSSESGTYTLKDGNLVLDFQDGDIANVSASYAETVITMEYEGANMRLLKKISYTVSFNSGGGSFVTAETVQNGKLPAVPETPTRPGYDFVGWYANAQFTEVFNFEAPVTSDVTAYAKWEKIPVDTQLPDPVMNVTSSLVSWNSIAGARSYVVSIIAPSGDVVYEESTSSTLMEISFDEYEAGIYTVRVTALANSGEQDNSSVEAIYMHNALAKVDGFKVDNGLMLIYNKVENAEKYYVTVVCGNTEHKHESFDNGDNRFFDISSCPMTSEGIKVTVVATASGYASSTSDEFVYKRELSAVEGLRFDEATQSVYWNDVADASGYMVSVTCGNESHEHGFVNNGTQNFVSLKECAPLEGGIVVKVYPVTNGYISPAASEFKYEKSALQTPSGLSVNGVVLSWNAVDVESVRYEVKIDGKTYVALDTTLDLSEIVNYVEGTEYAISVRALTDSNASVWSDTVVARYYDMAPVVTYSKSTLTWAPVIGAQGYEIQVNDGEIASVPAGATSAPVVLTKAGTNTVKVRFVDGNVRSEWVSVDVYAHAVTFDTLGGSEILVQYKAVGDLMVLPEPTKTGYEFLAWYNVPGGAASNGKVYDDTFFAGSGAMVLYAQYDANEYDISYNLGVGGTSEATGGKVKYENHYTLDVPTAKEPTSAFGGWFSAPYGMGTQYTDAEGNSLVPWNTLGGTEMYAFWVDYTLEFTLTKLNGQNVYAVSKGTRISLVSEVTVPATYKGLPVALVSGNAFLNCTNLKVVNLPASVQQISSISPFGGCTALTAINVYDVEGVSARYWSADGVLFDNGTVATDPVAKLLIMPLAKTGKYTIPEGVVEIPRDAFANSALSRVTIPASVTKIASGAFNSCKLLTAVTFATAEGEQPLTIDSRAFEGCTSLERIILPARLAEIKLQKYSVVDGAVVTSGAENAFAGCTALSSVTVASANENYKSVDGVVYTKNGKTLVYCPAAKAGVDGVFSVPAGVQVIAPGAFVDCGNITEIAIPRTVTNVGECAFYGLSKLTKVSFAGGGLSDLVIGKYAFRGCSRLADLVFEAGSRLSVISEGAFYGCARIENFNIPATVTSVMADAFRDCTRLETVTFAASKNPVSFGENAFYNCLSLESIHLPANVTTLPGVFTGCKTLTTVTVDENSEYFTSIDGVLFNKAETEIIFFPIGKTGEYTLPATVTVIGNGVFNDRTGITTLTISNTVTSIGESAFSGASIEAIVFVGEATGTLTIEKNAFNGATIGTMALPAHTVSVGESAFENASFTSITLNEGLLTLGDRAFAYATGDVTLPASVKSIGDSCFLGEFGDYSSGTSDRGVSVVFTYENSALETIGNYAFSENPAVSAVLIPASVKTIGNYAFYGCEELDSLEFAPESKLETIGAFAFTSSSSWYAPQIETLVIPKNVTSIGAYAFANLPLTSVTFEAGGTEDLVLGTSYLEVYTEEGVTVSQLRRGNVFYYCDDLETVVLPKRLVEIGEECFKYAGYYAPLNVSFNAEDEGDIRLTTIGARAFQSSRLESFVVPKSVRNLPPVLELDGNMYDRLAIGEEAFEGCYKTLVSVTFEAGGTEPLTIGAGAFDGCSKLAAIELPANLAPYTSHTGDVLDGLAGGAEVFAGCGAISNVTMNGEGSYYVCVDGVLFTKDMTELLYYPAAKEGTVTVPASVTKIHNRAFYGASALTAITFQGGTDDLFIGDEAFAGCSALETVVLPDNVVSLGDSAFYGCESITSLTLSKKLIAFNAGMIEGCSALAEINVGADGAGDEYSSLEGVLYNKDKSTLIFYPSNKEATEFTLPETVKVIAAGAFKENKNLVTVTLPAGLVEINEGAFYGASALANVNIPGTVTLIAKNAFRACTSLVNVTFAADGDDLLIINDYAFGYTSSLGTVSFPARLNMVGNSVFYSSGIEKVSFAENSRLTTVGDAMFSLSSVVEIAFPEGLISIGNETFFRCTSLKKVSFGEGLLQMGDRTFARSTSVEEVNFPSTLKNLGKNTFYYYDYDPYTCDSLKKVSFGENSQLEAIPQGTFAYTALESIVIPASVKEIGDRIVESSDSEHEKHPGAFDGCANLVSVSFEEGSICEKIGASAFYNCKKLASVEIPGTVSTLGASAFYNCEALESIIIPATVTELGSELFYSCDNLAEVTLLTKATVLPSYLFYNCKSLKSIVIPEGVSTMESACFDGTSIKEIVLPESLVSFSGYGMFADCAELETVTILGNVTAIARDMFENCESLAYITLPASVEYIDERAFANCTALEEITLPAALADFDSTAFENSALMAYKVAEGNETFSAVDGVLYSADKTQMISYPVNKVGETFVVPKEVAFIGEGVFSGVSSIKTILFEDGGTADLEIGDGAFMDLVSLGSIVLPERTFSIGDYAFAYCSSLLSINIPSGMKEVDFGYEAFYACTKLVEICNKSEIELEKGSEMCGGVALYAVRIYSEGESTAKLDEEGYITIEDGGEVYLVSYTGTDTELTFPEGITAINPYAFYKTGITKVTLPEGLKIIGEGAFADCGDLETVVMSNTVEIIGDQAFYYCYNLSDFNFSTSLKEIGYEAFYSVGLTSIALPESLETIGEGAFYYSDIGGSVVIGANVSEIGYRAFYGTSDITFYVAASEQPAGWDSSWNSKSYSGNHEVLWGFTGENITYTFVTGEGATAVDQIVSGSPIDLPAAPTRPDYIFGGWYDNEACEGTALTNGYYNSVKNTIYAKWLTQAEFEALYAGTSPEYAIEASSGISHTITDDSTSDKKYVYLKVTASEAKTLTVSTVSGVDTVVYIYDNIDDATKMSYNYVKYQDGSGTDETLTFSFEAGKTYYIIAYAYYGDFTGEFTVNVTEG